MCLCIHVSIYPCIHVFVYLCIYVSAEEAEQGKSRRPAGGGTRTADWAAARQLLVVGSGPHVSAETCGLQKVTLLPPGAKMYQSTTYFCGDVRPAKSGRASIRVLLVASSWSPAPGRFFTHKTRVRTCVK